MTCLNVTIRVFHPGRRGGGLGGRQRVLVGPAAQHPGGGAAGRLAPLRAAGHGARRHHK